MKLKKPHHFERDANLSTLNKILSGISCDLVIVPLLQDSIDAIRSKQARKLYPGPPNYESIENGDCPEYCWMLQMDSKSFDIASKTPVLEPALSMTDIMSVSNWTEVQLGLETDMRKFCESHINQKVTLQGYLSHAILAHHYAPFLMSVQSVYGTEESSTEENSEKEITSN